MRGEAARRAASYACQDMFHLSTTKANARQVADMFDLSTTKANVRQAASAGLGYF